MSQHKVKLTYTGRSYIKRETGRRVFVYAVTGKPEAIEAYKKLNPKSSIDEATGAPLKMSVDFLGKSAEMATNQDGSKFYVNTEAQDIQLALLAKASKAGIDVSGALLAMNGNVPVAQSAPAPASAEGLDD